MTPMVRELENELIAAREEIRRLTGIVEKVLGETYLAEVAEKDREIERLTDDLLRCRTGYDKLYAKKLKAEEK